jgi:hypothetical protein
MTQIIIIAATILVFGGLGFAMHLSIKKHDKNYKNKKKKKGKNKYMPMTRTGK